MKSQMTPGPWKISSGKFNTEIWDHHGNYIARLNHGMTATIGDEANAKAISALPDLLEACQELVSAWQNAPQAFFTLYGNHFDAAVGMSREAIRKATD